MVFTLVSFGIVLLIYIIIGIILAVRIHSLSECGKHKPLYDHVWVVIFFWILAGFVKLWKEGIDSLDEMR